jgi:hypothetical protein
MLKEADKPTQPSFDGYQKPQRDKELKHGSIAIFCVAVFTV